jgi:hypothetical protein
MDLPSPFKVPSVPGTPLYALSPERMNQQRRLPESPSLPEHLSSPERKHHRNSSDVRSKVEFLNSLSGLNAPPSPTRQNAISTNAALQRAMLGREEAEAQLSFAQAQLKESQSRELRIAERVESLMEELQGVKERQVHERQVFEKEVRKARKEAFKAGSATVKAQEDLKEARQELKTAKGEAQRNQEEKEKARQEAFERAYALAGLAEEMEVIREKLKSVEKERDTALVELQANLAPKTATVTRSDAQVQTEPSPADSQPISAGNDSRPASRSEMARPESRTGRTVELLPTRPPTSAPLIKWGLTVLPQDNDMEEDDDLRMASSKELQHRLVDLRSELRWEKTQRQRADETVHMLQMECQFNACACRLAEARGERFVHDKAMDAKVQAITAERKRKAKEEVRTEPPKQPRTSETMNESLDTAVLEDMTQVIVEANPRQQQFCFSTSTNSRFQNTEPTPRFEQPQSAHSESDLFDLSPPKHAPARPSTAMGVITLASPIRVVLDSPQPRPASGTPPSAHRRSRTVALKDPTSPLRHSARASTRSPSFSTIPAPATPGFRFHADPIPRMQLHSQTQTISTTTTVPLRGLDSDDVFSNHGPATPGTPVSREAALAQIRARRDRARSVNLKSAAEKGSKTPGSARRGLGAVIFADGVKGRRDVSQASAPGRI